MFSRWRRFLNNHAGITNYKRLMTHTMARNRSSFVTCRYVTDQICNSHQNMYPASSRYVTWIIQIHNIFLFEKWYELLYMWYTSILCVIMCNIIPFHIISIYLIDDWVLTQPWQSYWCEGQIVQICKRNHPDMLHESSRYVTSDVQICNTDRVTLR